MKVFYYFVFINCLIPEANAILSTDVWFSLNFKLDFGLVRRKVKLSIQSEYSDSPAYITGGGLTKPAFWFKLFD